MVRTNITMLTDIEFGFENVEVVAMPARFLKAIGISDIRRCVFGGDAIDNGLFKRISQFNDIVDLTLTYEDGSLVIEIDKDFCREAQSE